MKYSTQDNVSHSDFQLPTQPLVERSADNIATFHNLRVQPESSATHRHNASSEALAPQALGFRLETVYSL